MTAYPLTPEQRQELHERAKRVIQRGKDIHVDALAFILGTHVFEDGRHSQTVPYQELYEIALEEWTTPRLVEAGAEDAEKWHLENVPKPKPPLGKIRRLD